MRQNGSRRGASPRSSCRGMARRVSGVLPRLALLLAITVSCASKEPATPDPAFAAPDPIETIDAFIAERVQDTTSKSWKTRLPRSPFVRFPRDKNYYWLLHTSEGLIKILLKPEWAPHHVSSTIYLTRLGFYDSLTFHRIVPGFMAQGGDPLGTGGGGPGYRYAGEFHKKAKHKERGVVSMANAGPRTDGSQFFIMFKEAEHLDGKHTVFGTVSEGRGTLGSLEILGQKSGEPRRKVEIVRAEIYVEVKPAE